MNPFSLQDKTILVTGANGFLGRHFTDALRTAGATVVATDVTPEAEVMLDVSSKQAVDTAFGDIIAQHEKIDVVVNNAAIDPKFDTDANPSDAHFENYPEELLQQSLDINLRGYVFVAQAAVKHMLTTGSGIIINVSSIYGLGGPYQDMYPNGAQKPVDYAITKGGVVMLTKWLATTYGKHNIRANTYTLGGVLRGHDEAFQAEYGKRCPLGRMVNTSEVGPPLVYLASPAARGMTGANLVVDGGWTAW